MTVREVDELSRCETLAEQELADHIRSLTPENVVSMSAVAKHGPPQEWWDADDDPTTPAGGEGPGNGVARRIRRV